MQTPRWMTRKCVLCNRQTDTWVDSEWNAWDTWRSSTSVCCRPCDDRMRFCSSFFDKDSDLLVMETVIIDHCWITCWRHSLQWKMKEKLYGGRQWSALCLRRSYCVSTMTQTVALKRLCHWIHLFSQKHMGPGDRWMSPTDERQMWNCAAQCDITVQMFLSRFLKCCCLLGIVISKKHEVQFANASFPQRGTVLLEKWHGHGARCGLHMKINLFFSNLIPCFPL